MSEIKPALWIAHKDFSDLNDEEDGVDALKECATVSNTSTKLHKNDVGLYTKQQLDKTIEERDILIRDLRKELNERRYGRSANQ